MRNAILCTLFKKQSVLPFHAPPRKILEVRCNLHKKVLLPDYSYLLSCHSKTWLFPHKCAFIDAVCFCMGTLHVCGKAFIFTIEYLLSCSHDGFPQPLSDIMKLSFDLLKAQNCHCPRGVISHPRSQGSDNMQSKS